MENIQYFVSSLNTYSNLLTVVLTVAVIYFAYRSLRSSQEANRLNTLPIFFTKVFVSEKKTVLIIENFSTYPGYDVDVFVLGTYFEESVPHKSLLSDKFKNKVKINFSDGLYNYDSEHYSVYDRTQFYAFPPNRKIEYELNLMIPPETLEIIVQFRDSMGQNYLYQSWLFSTEKERRTPFTLGSFTTYFKPTKRIGIIESTMGLKDLFEIAEATDHINIFSRFLRLIPMYSNILLARIRIYFYIDKDIRDSLLRSFSSGYQRNTKNFSDKETQIFTRI